jgi:hypothetical protein
MRRPGYTDFLLRLPDDWIASINAARGDMDYSQFFRECIRRRIGKGKRDLPTRPGRPHSKQS